MSVRGQQQARPLFVISDDYGELGLAMNFLRGQNFAERAVMALPERLYPTHSDILRGATHRYSSTRELLDLVAACDANVVLLFSGYLLSNNRIVSRRSLAAFLRHLRERRRVVVTSDPFLGLAAVTTRKHLRLMDLGYSFSKGAPLTPEARRVFRGAERRYAEGLSATSAMLKDVIHLYHAVPDEWTRKQSFRSVAFYNPRASDAIPAAGERRWLFVLGAEDAAVHERLLAGGIVLGGHNEAIEATGKQRLADIVASLLRQTTALGRRPVLVAPPAVIAAMSPELHSACELVPFCPFPRFSELALNADIVFYWNVFSASVLPRLAVRAPVFFFDRGHSARLMPLLYKLGLELHFGGWSPAYLDPTNALDTVCLTRTWAQTGFGNQLFLETWRAASPSPEVLLSQLVNE